MDDEKELRRIFLAGVGMMSEACDVTRHTLEELTERGTEFLKRQSEATRKWFDEMVEKGERVMAESAQDKKDKSQSEPGTEAKSHAEEDLLKKVSRLSPEAKERLRKILETQSGEDAESNSDSENL